MPSLKLPLICLARFIYFHAAVALDAEWSWSSALVHVCWLQPYVFESVILWLWHSPLKNILIWYILEIEKICFCLPDRLWRTTVSLIWQSLWSNIYKLWLPVCRLLLWTNRRHQVSLRGKVSGYRLPSLRRQICPDVRCQVSVSAEFQDDFCVCTDRK